MEFVGREGLPGSRISFRDTRLDGTDGLTDPRQGARLGRRVRREVL